MPTPPIHLWHSPLAKDQRWMFIPCAVHRVLYHGCCRNGCSQQWGVTRWFTGHVYTYRISLIFLRIIQKYLRGHVKLLHVWVALMYPVQLVPLPDWGGSSQLRIRDCSPPPQVILHVDHACHEPHPPLTAKTFQINSVSSGYFLNWICKNGGEP